MLFLLLLLLLLSVGCLTSQQHAGVSQGRICSMLPTATLRQKLRINFFFIPTSVSILTPGQPVPALTLYARRLAGSDWSTNFEVTGMTRPGKSPTAKAGIEARVCRSRIGRDNHKANELVDLNPQINLTVHGCTDRDFKDVRKLLLLLRSMR